MFLTTVPAPALSSRRGRMVRRVFEMLRDGIGRIIFHPPETALRHVLSLGRGKQVREVVKTNVELAPPKGRRPTDATWLREKDVCGFLPKAATPGWK
jgi:hypothetical protein